METRLLQREYGKRSRSPAKQWGLSQTEGTARKNWGCPLVTGTLLCTAPWGEQTGPVRKHPMKFSVNYCLDVSLQTFVSVPLVYSFTFLGW